jgi:hypothetical protein
MVEQRWRSEQEQWPQHLPLHSLSFVLRSGELWHLLRPARRLLATDALLELLDRHVKQRFQAGV